MTDGITHVGVGMTMTRINADGDVEAIKDRKVEARVEMLISGDLASVQTYAARQAFCQHPRNHGGCLVWR